MRNVVLGIAMLGCGSAMGQSVRVLQIPAHHSHGQLIPRAISGDGTVIVGFGETDGAGLVWPIGGELEVVPSPWTRATANNISADGSVIVGITRPSDPVGFRWERGGAFTLLDGRGGGPAVYSASSISDDKTIIYGQSRVNNQWGGVRWTELLSEAVPGPDGSAPVTAVNSCSADGSALVGTLVGNLSFMRTPATGSVLIPLYPGLSRALSAQITSTGELVLAGAFEGPGTSRHYTWNPDTGSYTLPLIPGQAITTYQAICDDGRVIAGTCVDVPTSGTNRAVVWTPGGGAEFLSDYLNHAGASLNPTDLGAVTGISRDGNTFVGRLGVYPRWVAILEPGRPADFNLDRIVDFFDLNDFLDCWEGRTRMPLSTADLNHDGFTDFFDLIEFLDRFER